ncbi:MULTISPECIES: hypothetical protein [unclassified Campylobacter]|uniref:hypothetical protein n=1 Tax=unclassified Campylobacter TaxID=2593542 RepID=UPI003D33E0EC
MNLTQTHKKRLIELMQDGSEVTAGRVYGISNANQYLNELYREKIVKFRWCKDESRPNVRFKLWRITDFKRAEKYLNR